MSGQSGMPPWKKRGDSKNHFQPLKLISKPVFSHIAGHLFSEHNAPIEQACTVRPAMVEIICQIYATKRRMMLWRCIVAPISPALKQWLGQPLSDAESAMLDDRVGKDPEFDDMDLAGTSPEFQTWISQ